MSDYMTSQTDALWTAVHIRVMREMVMK